MTHTLDEVPDRRELFSADAYNFSQGIDQLRPSMGLQVQNPNRPTQNQFVLASQQQQALAQAQAQGNLGNSPNYGFGGVPRGNYNAKDGQPPRNDGSICSPVQSNSPKVVTVSEVFYSKICSLNIFACYPILSHAIDHSCFLCI